MSNTRTAWPTGQHEEVRARVAAHRAADEIVQGVGWDSDNRRGCAVGCSLDKYDHEEYARVLGIPLEIAYLVEAIHERLPSKLALDWPGRVVNALNPGADTAHVWSRFVIWLLRSECPSESGERVAALYERRTIGDEPSDREWAEARAEARAAARTAEWAEWADDVADEAARVARVARAARVAAWVAARAVQEAVREAEDAAKAAKAAKAACYQRMADALIEILASL